MVKTHANPGGLPMEVFDQLRASAQADRSQFFKDLSMPFYGYYRPGAKVSEGVRNSCWVRGMMAGFPACYFCIKAFSETGSTEDFKRFDVPTLILHGNDDQIVPIGASAMLSSKMVKDAKLKVHKGAPHGIACWRTGSTSPSAAPGSCSRRAAAIAREVFPQRQERRFS